MEKLVGLLAQKLPSLGAFGVLMMVLVVILYWHHITVVSARKSFAKLALINRKTLAPDVALLLDEIVKSCATNAVGFSMPSGVFRFRSIQLCLIDAGNFVAAFSFVFFAINRSSTHHIIADLSFALYMAIPIVVMSYYLSSRCKIAIFVMLVACLTFRNAK